MVPEGTSDVLALLYIETSILGGLLTTQITSRLPMIK